jgi:uncharacterized membrane protein YkvA (DUF1232 family)
MQSKMGLVEGLVRQGRLTWRLYNDSRVPRWVKLIPVAGLIYLISPIDLIPDMMLPGLGQLDDVAVILLSLKLFIDLCPPGIVREYLDELAGGKGGTMGATHQTSDSYIDVPYVVLDPEQRETEGDPS